MVQPPTTPPEPERESVQPLGLVVERGPQQSVMIGDDIEVILLHAGGDRAQLGIIAPEGVKVARGEQHRRPSAT